MGVEFLIRVLINVSCNVFMVVSISGRTKKLYFQLAVVDIIGSYREFYLQLMVVKEDFIFNSW